MYESLSSTVGEWEELAYREDLLKLSGVEAASVLWLDHGAASAVLLLIIGVFLYITSSNYLFLSLFLLSGIVFLLSYRYKPKHKFENHKKAVKHMKRILGDNALMPALIAETGAGGSSLLLVILYALDYRDLQIGFSNIWLILGLVISISTSFWLTKRLIAVWDQLAEGIKPVNYKDGLMIMTTVLITLYFFSGLFIMAGVFTHKSEIANLSIMAGPLFIQAGRLFRETYSN